MKVKKLNNIIYEAYQIGLNNGSQQEIDDLIFNIEI